MAAYTYKADEGVYDVEKLNDTAKAAFNYLAELQSEIQGLSKKVDILNAAAKTFNDLIQDNLAEEALVLEEEEEVTTTNED